MRWFILAFTAQFLASGGLQAADNPVSQGGTSMTITVTSTAFQHGGMIPSQHTCDGANRSPALAWSGVPAEAKSIALIVDDPDAPRGDWVHWVLYDLPADAKGLPESVPQDKLLAGGGTHGQNDFGRPGYGGPCPPSGTHRYYFKVYALDARLDLQPARPRPRC